MGSAVLTNSVGTYVTAWAPTTNNDTKTGLASRTGGLGDAWGLIYWPRPFPLRATILTAKIIFYTQAIAEAGTHTFTFTRLAQSFSSSKATWNTRPTAYQAGTKTVAKTGAQSAGVEWQLDITDWMQAVSSGGAWYGVRFQIGDNLARYVYAENHPTTAYRPRLEVTWSDAPAAPSGLSPSGGRRVGVSRPVVRATYLDVSGATALQAVQVQANATDVWTSPTFDSGTVLSSVPELDLSATAFSALADGASTFWRIRFQDAAGLWSSWSASTSFTYDIKGTLTLSSPAADTGLVVSKNEQPSPQPTTTTGWTGAGAQAIITAPWDAARSAIRTSSGSSNVNLCTNSTFDVDLTGWTETDPNAIVTLTRDTTTVHAGAGSLKVTYSGGGAGQAGGGTIVVSGLTVGLTYTISAWIYCPTGSTALVPVIVSPSGATSLTSAPAANTWTLRSVSFQAVGTSHSLIIRNFAVSSAGQSFYIDDVTFIRLASTTHTFSAVSPSAFTAGDLITARIKVKASNPNRGYYMAIHQRSPNVYLISGNYGVTHPANVLRDTNTGWVELVLSGTLAADVAAGQLDIAVLTTSDSNGLMAYIEDGETITLGDAMIERYTGPTAYFDGATTAGGGYSYRWTGTANASPSEKYIVQPGGQLRIEDATPPIIWTFTGETQAAYQVQISHLANSQRIIDWDSGKVTSATNSITVPAGKINEPSGTVYTLTLRVWDNEARESVPNSPVYQEQVSTFTFVPGATIRTTNITATPGDPRPTVALTWQRTSAPDKFNILRNGKVIAASLDPADVFVSGTSYAWTDDSPSPQRSLLYTVQAVVGTVASSNNDTATTIVRSKGIWLREPVSGLEVCLTGKDDRSFTLGEISATLQSIAPNSAKVAINQSQGGLEGRIEGDLRDVYGRTAQQWRDDFLKLRALRVKRFWLTVGDYTCQVVAQNFTYQVRTLPVPAFHVGFDVYQQDSITTAYL